jgi:CRISPR-associated protein Cas2
LIEPRTGVFLGNPSARVRDELWKLAVAGAGPGNAIQIWSDRGPQGFQHRGHGPNDREIVDVEGVALVRRRTRVKEVAVIPEKPAAPVEEEEELLF